MRNEKKWSVTEQKWRSTVPSLEDSLYKLEEENYVIIVGMWKGNESPKSEADTMGVTKSSVEESNQ